MYLMLAEIKTHGRDLDNSQRDLLHIVNQLLRTTPWREQRDSGRFIAGHRQNVRNVYSIMSGRKAQVLCYGVHVLRMSGSTPDESERIAWDGKQVDSERLVRLLRFDLHPDSLRPMEHRSHKELVAEMPSLFSAADLAMSQASENGAA